MVIQYLAKGRRVLVQGRLRQDSWDDKETGKKQSRIEVTATDVTFLDGPNGESGSSNSSSSSSSNSASSSSNNSAPKDVVIQDIDDKPIDLSEIPF